jgi:hypothetical protein
MAKHFNRLTLDLLDLYQLIVLIWKNTGGMEFVTNKMKDSVVTTGGFDVIVDGKKLSVLTHDYPWTMPQVYHDGTLLTQDIEMTKITDNHFVHAIISAKKTLDAEMCRVGQNFI